MIHAYIVSIVAVYLAYLARIEKNKAALPFAFIIITVFLSLGYNWGNDVPTYETWFWLYNEYPLFDFTGYELISDKTEYGFVLINQLCKGVGFWWMRAFLFCLENYIIYSFVRRTVPRENYWLAVFIYVFNPNFMILGSSMMRQWLAMCIIVLAFMNLQNRKWLVFIILVLLAGTIHRTALICLPVVFLPYFTNNLNKIKLTGLIVLIFVYFILSRFFVAYLAEWLLTEDMYNYSDSTYMFGIGIMVIVNFGFYLFMFINVKQVEKPKRIYITVLIAYGLLLPLYSISGLASRLGFFFTVFTISAYPIFLKQSNIDKNIKLIFTILIVALCIYNNVLFFTSPTWRYSFGTYTSLFQAGIL